MALEEKIRLLSLVDVLGPLSAEEIGWLGRRTPDVRLRRGQTFYTPEYAAKVIFLLLEGRMRVYKLVGGRQLTLDVLNAGTMFGEAALADRPQGTYAEALEPSWVAFVSLDTLRRLAQRNPEVGLKVAELLSERLHLYGSRMADIGLKGVYARLASLFLWLVESEGIVTGAGRYRIPTRYTHGQLGTMIGAERVAVSRAFAKLREIGAVEVINRYVHVRDVEALKRAAGTKQNPGQNPGPKGTKGPWSYAPARQAAAKRRPHTRPRTFVTAGYDKKTRRW